MRYNALLVSVHKLAWTLQFMKSKELFGEQILLID